MTTVVFLMGFIIGALCSYITVLAVIIYYAYKTDRGFK